MGECVGDFFGSTEVGRVGSLIGEVWIPGIPGSWRMGSQDGRIRGDRITPIYKPCIWPFGRGPTTRSLGDLRSPWLLLTTYMSWDDPPSMKGIGNLGCTPIRIPNHQTPQTNT